MHQIPITILLVEDSPSDANLLAHIFSRSHKDGWQLLHAERLDEAIEFCKNCRFDLILLDLGLPDSDGLETVTEFHKAEPNIPIVVLTGSDDDELALQALAEGAQDYLVKDQINSQLLIRAIRYAIERGQILKQLQDSEQRFRGIFDQTFQFMALLTPAGIILEINKTALDFISAQPEDLVGLPLWETTCWNHSAEIQEWLKKAISDAAEGVFIRKEVEVCGASDRKVWIDFSVKPLQDKKGNVVMLIAEGRNISDRKRAETEILKNLQKERELNQLKSKFVSMVSHEFRNPMTVISGFVGILQSVKCPPSEEKKSKYYQRIQEAIDRMVQLLDEILAIGKNEAVRLNYKPAPLNLEEFCRELTEELQLSASSQHELTFTCKGKCNQAEMDEVLLRHIFTNLISNAIKYSPQGGHIRFELICDNGWANFRVQDEGIGIPLKDQPHLFDTFQRGSNVEQIEGTGLGLAVVKNCVDLHRGKIHLESEVGVGTTVKITLPLNQPIEIFTEIEQESATLVKFR